MNGLEHAGAGPKNGYRFSDLFFRLRGNLDRKTRSLLSGEENLFGKKRRALPAGMTVAGRFPQEREVPI